MTKTGSRGQLHFTIYSPLARLKRKRLSVTHTKTPGTKQSETSVLRRLHFPGYTAASALREKKGSQQRQKLPQNHAGALRRLQTKAIVLSNHNSQNAARPQHPETKSSTFTQLQCPEPTVVPARPSTLPNFLQLSCGLNACPNYEPNQEKTTLLCYFTLFSTQNGI